MMKMAANYFHKNSFKHKSEGTMKKRNMPCSIAAMLHIHKFGSIFFAVLVLLSACDSEPDFAKNESPFMEITNGQFEIDAILTINSADPSDSLLGSGSLSFDFAGDINGTYSAAGQLILNQTDSGGVGAVLDRVNNLDFNTIDEGFSILGFLPRSNGRADIFSVGTQLFAPVDSIEAGRTFGIGPSGPFVGAYFKGVAIADFWSGDVNLFQASEQAFGFTAGTLFISTRDSTHITGSLTATTDPSRSSGTGSYILR